MSIEQLTEENINENAAEVAVEEVVAENTEVVEEATVAKATAPQKTGKPTVHAYGKGEFLTDEQLAKRKKVAAVWDKITTGLLIALMASPVAIIGWIFFYFIRITLQK